MIRRDYILRMIEECIRALTRINVYKQEQRWDKISETLDDEFQRLVNAGAVEVARLSETELLARLMQEGPTQVLRQKALILVTLLKEAGEVAAAQNRTQDSRECFLKALHLLLETLSQTDPTECPEFVPKVEQLRDLLGDSLLLRTLAMLMQHYERTGDFAKAEDALFAMLDAEPDNHAIVEFGISFYERLRLQTDAALSAANLPRAEVEEGLKKIRAFAAKNGANGGD